LVLNFKNKEEILRLLVFYETKKRRRAFRLLALFKKKLKPKILDGELK